MPLDPRTRIRRRGAACCGGVLVFAVCLAPVPAAARFLHASSQTSVKVGCPAAGCDCYDNGVLTACPVDHEYFFNNGSPAAPIHGFASGTYVESGGLAVNCEATVDASVSFQDTLQLRGAVPLGPVSIRISQEISSTDFVLIGSGDYPINNCGLANGDATTSIDALLTTNHLSLVPGGGGGSRAPHTCAIRTSAPRRPSAAIRTHPSRSTGPTETLS